MTPPPSPPPGAAPDGPHTVTWSPTAPPHVDAERAPGTPPPQRRGPLLAALAVVAVVVVGGGIAVGVALSGDSPTTPPAAAGTSGAAAPAVASGPGAPAADDSGSVVADPTPTTDGLTGTWSGAVYGSQQGFDVVVDLVEADSRVSGRVSYPQLGCTGTWTQTSRDATRVDLLEQITSGPCVQTDIELTLTGSDTLGFRSSWSDKVIYADLRH